MISDNPFVAFPKIPRLKRTVVITEKIDGTNAQVVITPDGNMLVGSRNRYITPTNDNYGFAAWAYAHAEELLKLGIGTHYGEWWGPGIQRGYATHGKDDFKRFSLFNVARWFKTGDKANLPECVDVVPTLLIRELSDSSVNDALEGLRTGGSVAKPGFMNPEGVVVYFTAAGTYHKVLLEGDELPKGLLTHQERSVAQAISG